MIVLDTHVVLWWTLEPTRLSRAATREIAQAGRIGVPAIVLWETSVLVRRGRLTLDMTVHDWADQLLAIPRVECLPLDHRIALKADSLAMHPDPADRFIVATTAEHHARLLTKDAALRRLKLVEMVW